MSGSFATAKAFAGNAAFFLAALLVANMNNIKKAVLDLVNVRGKETNDAGKRKQDLEYVENLINSLANEKFDGKTDKDFLAKDFKSKMRKLFNLPTMKKIVPKLALQHMKDKSSRKQLKKEPVKEFKTFPLQKPAKILNPLEKVKILKTGQSPQKQVKIKGSKTNPTLQKPLASSSSTQNFPLGPQKYSKTKKEPSQRPLISPKKYLVASKKFPFFSIKPPKFFQTISSSTPSPSVIRSTFGLPQFFQTTRRPTSTTSQEPAYG